MNRAFAIGFVVGVGLVFAAYYLAPKVYVARLLAGVPS